MKVLHPAVVAVLLFAPLACAQDGVVHRVDYDVSGLNDGLVAGRLTCDLHFHLTQKGPVTWETVVKRLPKLREIFEPTGVQFRVASARLIEIPEAWHTHAPMRGEAPGAERTSFYAKYGETSRLAPATERVFREVVGDQGPGAELSVHFISLRKVDIGWWERDSSGAWDYKTAGTSACSFPPYMYADRIPARLRGAITLSTAQVPSRTLAHELGHKLINVSHEGVGRGPRGEQWGGDDLMIYGTGTRIPSGAEGRYQLQRLQRSPFLYRAVESRRQFNPPYREGGHYWDPVYEKLWAEPPPKREPPRDTRGLQGSLPGGEEATPPEQEDPLPRAR